MIATAVLSLVLQAAPAPTATHTAAGGTPPGSDLLICREQVRSHPYRREEICRTEAQWREARLELLTQPNFPFREDRISGGN
ncbi:putative membrane protein [Sphingomonas jejuensis]|uniref:Membrane protein n=1 Tax=Sphingomonas jejuensis TaxID=904715 RepID=A0ABX0XMD7_9SPHN|nr:hypothetical protein [Sphingomonas jejuensis]NJC34526.1 putative membrane protein [Sphingomonas jejuensis]